LKAQPTTPSSPSSPPPLHVPKRNIQIVSGERNRQKRVVIAGVTAEQVRALQ
jgi:uncharacterized protein YggU (UPF0235/DUF167 family)